MNITVIKKENNTKKAPMSTRETNAWFTKTTDNVNVAQVAQAWSTWIGNDYYGNQYSNMNSEERLVAILEDGTEVECLVNYYEAQTMQFGYWVGGNKGTRGTKVLPPNWVEIRYIKHQYTSQQKGHGGGSWETWTGNIRIAKRNADKTATVFKIPSAIYRKGEHVELH